MCVINDPLGQTHNPTSNDHYFHRTFLLFCVVLKSGYGRTDNTYENNDYYRLELWAGRLDQ